MGDGKLAEAARQLGKMVEYPSQSQPNPGLQVDGTFKAGSFLGGRDHYVFGYLVGYLSFESVFVVLI